jgi:ArsR family transcriptional regulator
MIVRPLTNVSLYKIDRLSVPSSFVLELGDATISNVLEIWLTDSDRYAKNLPMKIDDAAARLEALGNPTRLQIYRALVRVGEPGMAVGKLQSKLDLPASTLSHHLKTLMFVGLITQERQTTTLICRAHYDVMRTLVDFLVAECCADAACQPASKGKAA